MPGDTIIRDAQAAAGYDEQARVTDWSAPDVVFGLTYEFTAPGQSVLDLGIGSGLSSIPFHRVGLKVYGLDGSSEILKICRAKNFAVELTAHDLRALPLPYPSHSFNHVVCVGVLNSFQTLDLLFHEIARLMTDSGIFAFTVETCKPGQADSYAINREVVSEAPREETAVRVYRHSQSYITGLLEECGLILRKRLEFVAFSYPAENRDVMFTAYVAQRTQHKSMPSEDPPQ